MSLLKWMGSRLKLIFLCLINVVRRALCCFRRKKTVNHHGDDVLVDVISTSGRTHGETEDNWNVEWDVGKKKPSTISEHIEHYRESKYRQQHNDEEEKNESENFFEDMVPKIVPQKKILLTSKKPSHPHELSSRLKASDQAFFPMIQPELTEWEESDNLSTWEEEAGCDTNEIIREKRRADKERRMAEQMRKKQERSMSGTNKLSLSSKIS